MSNIRNLYLRKIKENKLPLNSDYFTNNKPTAQWYQSDAYSIGELKTQPL